MLPQQYCLRWKYHHSNLQTMFSQLLDRGCFCDVTLACEGQLIRAHRVVLCACSTFFDTVLTNYASERDPIIIMKDVTFADVKSLIEFMYKGEINVEHANLASLLKTADDLKIKGLAEVSWRDDEEVANGGSSGAAPPVGDTDTFATHSPQRMHDGYGPVSGGPAVAQDMRTSPSTEVGDRRIASPPSVQSNKYQAPTRLPTLTPKPSQSVTVAAAASSADQYYGPKRKRGRPPLDDAYDVFNVRKLAHYGGHLDSQPFLDAGRLHGAQHGDQHPHQRHPTSAYQQHIHQQQRRQRQKQEHQHVTDSDEADDNQTDPEWITSNLEVNVAECEAVAAMAQAEADSNQTRTEQQSEQNKMELNDKEMMNPKTSPPRDRERTPTETKAANEKNPPKVEHRFKKRSVLEKAKEQRQRESKEREREKEKKEREKEKEREREREREKDKEKEREQEKEKEKEDKYNDEGKHSEHEEDHSAVLLPQSVEEIEILQSHVTVSAAATTSESTITTTISSPSSTPTELPSTSSQTKLPSTAPAHAHTLSLSHSHAHSHPHAHIPPAHSHAHVHFAKYAAAAAEAGAGAGGGAGGYLLNEHGMLMTHDFPPHAAAAAAVMGAAPNGEHEFADIKMEDYDVADLRLTSEEMSEWQDVIKMDDYLAKGRRPQFWEEPFTRRVLDAIKNKRLEMKKAARILGVSYGTLYGRYREVYGCLKHPYSSSMRPSQSSQLAAVQPRFDIVWPSPKRDPGLQTSPLEIGKIRPKDLSELWARPQI